MIKRIIFFIILFNLFSIPLVSSIHTIAFFQIDLSNLEEVAVIIPTRYEGFQRDFERNFDKFSISVDGKECEFLGEQFQQYFFKCNQGKKLKLENGADLTGYVHFYGYVFVNSKEVIDIVWREKEYEVDLNKKTEQQHTHITILENFPVRKDFQHTLEEKALSENTNNLKLTNEVSSSHEDLKDKEESFLSKFLNFFKN